ncbi:MAG: sensor histidine kinase, partial [Massilia sp.]|nr:sensor histidine kinase [Massilia sp.]
MPLTPAALTATAARLAGLELLASAVLLVDADYNIRYANPAAEHLLDNSARVLVRSNLCQLFMNAEELQKLCSQALAHQYTDLRQDLTLERAARDPLQVHSIVSAIGNDEVIVELREIVQQLKLDREERILDQSQVNKELIRNLAHEIKNPLGGIRGAAQLLQMEVESRDLIEYTQVIIHEADRLQTLVDRLLSQHRRPHVVGDVNIHEVCERVRSVILAEFPRDLHIERDFDVSIPEFRGDREQL